MKPGEARCPVGNWSDIVANDARPAPDFLANAGCRYAGPEPVTHWNSKG